MNLIEVSRSASYYKFEVELNSCNILCTVLFMITMKWAIYVIYVLLKEMYYTLSQF
jgi:hypothetical protein